MKSFIIALLAGFAALSASQDLSKLPECARACVGNSLGTTGCNTVDFACICKSKDWIAGLSCCVSKGCSKADQDSTVQFAQSLCQIAGVTLPTQATCASSAGPTSTSTSSTATGAAATNTMTMTSGTMTGSTTAMAASGSTTMPSSGSTTASAAAVSSAAAANYKSHGVGAAGMAIAALAIL